MVLAVAVALVFSLWMAFTPGGPRAAVVFSDLTTVAVSLGVGITCVRAGLRGEGRSRRGWLLIGAGMLAWSSGETTWTVYEVVLGGEVSYPSVADIGYLAMVPLVFAGTGALVAAGRDTVRTVLDGLVISGSLLFVSWATVLGPIFRDSGMGPLEWVVSLAYPLGDLATASMVFVMLGYADRRLRTSLGLVGAGVLVLAVATARSCTWWRARATTPVA